MRKKVLEKSRFKDNKYKAIYENSPSAIIDFNFSSLAKLSEQLKDKTSVSIRQTLAKTPSLVKKTFQKVKISDANRSAQVMYSGTSARALMKQISRIFTGSALDLLIELYVSLLCGEKHFEGEFKCKSARRIFQDVFLSTYVPAESKTSLDHVIITFQDITTWKKLERQLRKRAKLDGLTKLLNHGAIVERLEEELIRAKRYGLNLSCLMIDLDFFKVINDKFGHQRGDKILRRVSFMIRNCFRKVDIVGRYGGDEFLVILPETKPDLSRYAAIRLQRIFANAMFKYKRIISFHITLSIGIAGYPSKRVKDARDMVSLADRAMYQCKMEGRNKILLA